jgi:two-component system, OmpR family, response regulator
MHRIAVVDDEKNIRAMVRVALEREGYAVDEYANGADAWLAFQSDLPCLAILDVMMPRMDGLELCKRLRSLSSELPLIFLSSRDEEIDRVLGLESGGDDYVCKPFGMRELIARIHAALRRCASKADPPIGSFSISSGSLELDDERYLARVDGRPAPLTVTEFRILRCLAVAPGAVKTREQLMRAAFPEDAYPNDRAADSHIKRIRAKLSAAGLPFERIEAVYGLGYRLSAGA